MAHVYREKSLQLAAVEWMAREWSYDELAGDVEATGDRMDSIGLLAGTIIAIEVKPSVRGGMVWFQPDRSGSLEAKIASTVGGLYRGETGHQLDIIRGHWDSATAPEIAILAGGYTETGFSELRAMLEQRGSEWRFNSRIWEWTGECIETLFRFDQAAPRGDWLEVDVPTLIGKQKRAAPPSIDDLHRLAQRGGHSETFSAFLALAAAKGYRVQRRPTGIALSGPRDAGLAVSLFLTDIDQRHGINAGIDAARIDDLDEQGLPGVHAPRAGHLNTNRYFDSPDAVADLFARLRPA